MFVQAGSSGAIARAIEYDPRKSLSFLKKGEGHEPVVIGQLGQSLDGRIATPSGASKYINGKEALCHLHRIRAEVDAVIVGVGTAIADDPQLTTRHVPGDSPARVVLDPHGRMPHHLTMLSDGAAPVFSVTCTGVEPVPGTYQIQMVCDGTARIDPVAIIAELASRGMNRILVEGGAETLARFLNAGVIGELHLMLAPIILGSGKTGLNLAPIDALDEALRPTVRTMRFRDGDMLCMCDMKGARVTVQDGVAMSVA